MTIFDLMIFCKIGVVAVVRFRWLYRMQCITTMERDRCFKVVCCLKKKPIIIAPRSIYFKVQHTTNKFEVNRFPCMWNHSGNSNAAPPPIPRNCNLLTVTRWVRTNWYYVPSPRRPCLVLCDVIWGCLLEVTAVQWGPFSSSSLFSSRHHLYPPPVAFTFLQQGSRKHIKIHQFVLVFRVLSLQPYSKTSL